MSERVSEGERERDKARYRLENFSADYFNDPVQQKVLPSARNKNIEDQKFLGKKGNENWS